MRLKIIFFVILFFILFTSPAFAHPGRTDANGGHTCRTNCEKWGFGYGEYHYHNGGGSTGGETVAQPVYPTAAPTPVVQKVYPTAIPTRKPIATPVPYKETEMDKKKLFKVVRIIDGDTLEVSIRGKKEKVRLLSIDTPETVDPRKPVQCFGKEASNKLSALVKDKYVKLVDDKSQGNRDKYQRLLRYLYLENGTFINKVMVAQGYAFSYKQYPTKHLEEFNKLEIQAKEKNLGLWNTCK